MTTRGPLSRPAAPVPAAAAVCALLLAALATVLALRDGAPLPVERALHDWAVARRGEPLLSLARAVSATGTGAFPYAMAVLAGLIAGRDARGRLRAAVCALAVLGLGQAVRYGLMALIARPRPPVVDWAGHPTGYSFPSGHSTTAVLAAGILAWAVLRRARPGTSRLWCAVLAAWALAVGLTRVYLGVHWPGDVLAGWLLAAVWLALALPVASGLLDRGGTGSRNVRATDEFSS